MYWLLCVGGFNILIIGEVVLLLGLIVKGMFEEMVYNSVVCILFEFICECVLGWLEVDWYMRIESFLWSWW